jgi:poly(A) polymerase Pap1
LLNGCVEVSEVVMIWAANVPLTKFKVHNISVDLIFAYFLTPKSPVEIDYFRQPHNICQINSKSLECINSLLSM